MINKRALEVHGIDKARMEKEGIDPKILVPEIVGILNTWLQKGFMVLGHNIAHFDAPIICREAKEAGCPFSFHDHALLDTGILVKAAQLGETVRPWETLPQFYARVGEIRAAGVYWSMERHCIKTYGLLEKAAAVKSGKVKAHDAGDDCLFTHLLLEELRKIGEAV